MRIAILTRFYPPRGFDGIPRTRWLYARELVKLGHEVHVITAGSDGHDRLENGVRVHEVSGAEQLPHLPSIAAADPALQAMLAHSQLVYRRLERLHRESPIDLIDSPLWELEGYVAKLRLPDIPMVVRLETTSMQLDELRGQRFPDGPQAMLHRFEANFLALADALVFDSWSILDEVRRLYRVDVSKKLHAVIHHGIETDGLTLPEPPADDGPRRILAVGRLERRKGTDLLIGAIIPRLLATRDHVEVHLVGRDNSLGDGFREETGLDYRQFLLQQAPGALDKRVFIHGAVPDEQLAEHFRRAHLLVCLSRYESFGLQYLEAMRSARPVVAFDVGGAREIFRNGDDGVLVPLDDADEATRQIQRLVDDAELARRIGVAGFRRLCASFSSKKMAERCAAFFEQVLLTRQEQPRVIQLMDCLVERDGVSAIAIDFHHLLQSMGRDALLVGRSADAAVRHEQTPLEAVAFRRDDVVLYHYWNFHQWAERDAALPGTKAMVFHNITDPTFFAEEDPCFESTRKGYRQLPTLNRFDGYAAFSQFSGEVLRSTIGASTSPRVIAPLVDAEALRAAPYDRELVAALRARPERKLLFVGRFVKHKRQEDLLHLVHHHRLRFGGGLRLYLVGSLDQGYLGTLRELAHRLDLDDQLCLRGGVSDEELRAYFRGCDAYVSMSEHEGFGLPLITAMVFGLPVIAFDRAAVGETVGDNGCLFREKDFPAIAELVQRLLDDDSLRSQVLERQNRRIGDFAPARVQEQLRELLDDLAQRRRRPI